MDILGDRTLRELWEQLRRDRAEHTFLVFEDRDGGVTEYDYGTFAELIGRTVALLRDLGVRRGDAVVVHLGNSPELLQCMFGVALLGAVFVPLHPRSSAAEACDVVARVRADVVITQAPYDQAYGPGGIETPHLLVVGEPSGAGLRFEHARDAHEPTLGQTPLHAEDAAGIVFTSGSTARPKGVVMTHANLVFSGLFVNWQAAMRPDDRLLTTMPACHVNFQLNALMPVLTAGATLIAVAHYSASRFWQQVRAHDATIVQSIAMILRTTMLQPARPDDRDHRVREVLYYLPVPDAEMAAFRDRFGVRILNSYGNSECLVGAITDPPQGERRWPSIGRVGLGYEARVVDEADREVPAGTPGEIQIKGVPGRTLMKGYFENPEATAAAYTADGWLRTGDVGVLDADGWFWFQDRRAHFLKRSGENISPAEVEAVLAAHPLVQEAVVVGVPDPVHDQAVKAIVLPRPGARPDPQELRAWCAARLAEFKVPEFVELVDTLPQTRTFKVARTSLCSGRSHPER